MVPTVTSTRRRPGSRRSQRNDGSSGLAASAGQREMGGEVRAAKQRGGGEDDHQVRREPQVAGPAVGQAGCRGHGGELVADPAVDLRQAGDRRGQLHR
jgi:hypothetical protein